MLFKVYAIQSWLQKVEVQGMLVPCTKGPNAVSAFTLLTAVLGHRLWEQVATTDYSSFPVKT